MAGVFGLGGSKGLGLFEILLVFLFVDAIATIFGSLCGTSTVTSYVENAAGV